MENAVVCVVSNREAAVSIVAQLQAAGIPNQDISAISRITTTGKISRANIKSTFRTTPSPAALRGRARADSSAARSDCSRASVLSPFRESVLSSPLGRYSD